MTNWQVLQFSGNGFFLSHKADTKKAALVLALPRPEGIACSIFREEALFGKAYFAENSNIDVQPN